MLGISRKTAIKAAAATGASVVVSVAIVLLIVPVLGGHPDGPGFWMSMLCPLVIAGPASTYQFHQKETIARQRDALACMHVELEDAHRALKELHADLRTRARTDSLTGGLNREAFFSAFEAAAPGSTGPAALIIADADHFKKINDTFGHLVGDEALRRIGAAISGCVGGGDLWGRIGGEEFVVFLAGQDRQGAIHTAERIRRSVSECGMIADGRPVPVSVSIGIAWAQGPFDPADFFRQADGDLYRAKSGGRNRIVMDGREVGAAAA
ncbi:GGDEF domain-containing protein [Sinorhizobium sp. BG8]|uniref:GGDEF domain-containing protein n=1 Tax=Sinorhizobium sp. BG8 TaxID=2613773 RepID=UPI00193C95F2|nr:GGDEF domain-containing protein [Sinorhizobium sp. BG8]QRM54470.1 GGDEF domain-containing protein [Sinorhizobium sp. BG8]